MDVLLLLLPHVGEKRTAHLGSPSSVLSTVSTPAAPTSATALLVLRRDLLQAVSKAFAGPPFWQEVKREGTHLHFMAFGGHWGVLSSSLPGALAGL